MTTESIQAKGLRLYRAGAVKHLQGDKCIVTGDTGSYEVHYEDTPLPWACECPSYHYCSHQAAAEIFTAKQNARAIRKLEAKREAVRRRGGYKPDTSQNAMIAAALQRMEA